MKYSGLFFRFLGASTVGLNVNRLWFQDCYDSPPILTAILGSGASHTKPSRRFYESPKSIDTLYRVSRKTANPEKGKLENCGLSCQSFS
jgi:hypothetical protein